MCFFPACSRSPIERSPPDQHLVDIVRRTEEVIRQVDYCARGGGEEFAVLLPEAGAGTAATVAERLREALDRTMHAPGSQRDIAYSVSIGIARLEPGETITALLCRADRALYLAKAAGRNTSVCAPAALVGDPAGSRGAAHFAAAAGAELAAYEQL